MANNEPDHIQVQHVLIAFSGSLPGQAVKRNKEEARALAYDLLKQAQDGADFDAMVKQYTDDSPPGIYGMSNLGVAPGPGEYPRNRMVAAFGDTGFPLEVGKIGIADFDPRTSPYGWHIVKRLK